MSKAIRFWFLIAGCLWLLVMPMSGVAAENSGLNFGPPAAWVKAHTFDQQSINAPIDAGADQHLLLYEQQLDAAENETFIHSARQILTTEGVQKDSTLTIEFNPAYQSLTWHWARIWRDGRHLERLDTNSVTLIQKEQDLDQFLVDGRKSAVLVLDDVRVGDIIDYAYSIKGENPVLGGHFSAEVPVQLAEPAGRLVTRVLWPQQRRLYAKTHGCTIEPAAYANKGEIEYFWDLNQVPALTLEDSLPANYDPEPWVQLSEFKSWADVAQWALALFETKMTFSPELSRKIEEWRQISDQEQQVLAVLRFVQDDVRYFGIEIGVSSEKPADPSAVFGRRFGDCKDKSRLFVSILRMLGLEAFPVLVNSTLGRSIDDWQPSASAFDHCIAVVVCNGQSYWLDPTMNYQRGSLASHFLPRYERGLVISPATTALSVIPQSTGLPLTTTTEYFQIGDWSQPTSLRVITVAEGGDADDLRAFFATTKRTEIERQYVHYYSDTYAGIKMSSPVVIDDDEADDRFQTTENYSIDTAWTYSDQDRKYRFAFYPTSIAGLMKVPVDTDRKLPLGIAFPMHQILRTEVTLPKMWTFEIENKNIYDPAFVFHKKAGGVGNKLGMEYEYQSLNDTVPPDSVADYLQRVKQVTDTLGNTLIWR